MAITSIPSSLPAASAARDAGTSVQRIGADAGGIVAVEPSDNQANVTPTPTTAESALSQAQIHQAMEQIQRALPPVARNLQFSVDNDTGQTVVRVVDPTTKEVIRQIPSEELLEITKSLESFTGLLVKEKV